MENNLGILRNSSTKLSVEIRKSIHWIFKKPFWLYWAWFLLQMSQIYEKNVPSVVFLRVSLFSQLHSVTSFNITTCEQNCQNWGWFHTLRCYFLYITTVVCISTSHTFLMKWLLFHFTGLSVVSCYLRVLFPCFFKLRIMNELFDHRKQLTITGFPINLYVISQHLNTWRQCLL